MPIPRERLRLTDDELEELLRSERTMRVDETEEGRHLEQRRDGVGREALPEQVGAVHTERGLRDPEQRERLLETDDGRIRDAQAGGGHVAKIAPPAPRCKPSVA